MNITTGNSGILQSGKHLPLVIGRTSHEARGALAIIGPLAEAVTVGLRRGVYEGTRGGVRAQVGRVSLAEAQRALVVDVDLLAAGDDDILIDPVSILSLRTHTHRYSLA